MLLPSLSATGLPLLLVPLLMAILCGVGLLQRPHASLRLLLLASLCSAVGLPLAVPVSDSVPAGAIPLCLLASGMYWQAIAGILGRRPKLAWLAVAPVLWLALYALPWMRHGNAGLIAAVLIDHVLTLLCLIVLIRAPRRTTGHGGLILATLLHPVVTGLYLVVVVIPAPPAWVGAAAFLLMAEMLVRVVLWPGIGLLMVLEMAALRDELSGALNRRGFWQAAELLENRSLLLFDIDHFKRINDTLGHVAGDLVIRRFTTVAMATFGEDAIFGRIGGEEFVAALTGINAAQARRLADRVRIEFSKVGDADKATVSVGISMPGAPGQSLGDQFALADRALYRAKRQGRNCTVMHMDDTANTVGPRRSERPPFRRSVRDE